MKHSIETEVALLRQSAISRDKEIVSLLLALNENKDAEHIRWDEINRRLKNLENTQLKQKTFIGAVIFITSALWGVVILVLKFFSGAS